MDLSLIYNSSDTICAITTPAGTGAIAVIRLSGPDAFAIADRIWKGSRLSSAATHTAHLGYIIDPEAPDTPLDQALATVFRAPGTFTGDDIIEFSIHGSRWLQQRLIALLVRTGARTALPGEFTRRAFASGKMDLAEAEAVADLIAASSEASHRIALNQMRGHYSRRLDALRDELLQLASLLELELDFSEEDVEFASRERLLTLAENLRDELSRLADGFAAGAAIKAGIPVAIVGATNAGKSSLLNALLGDDRAIVSDIHGTTRDIVEDTLEIGQFLIRFKDTAGLRHTTDTIEQMGIGRSIDAARTATLIIHVIDPTADSPAEPLPDDIDPARIITVINKSDIAPNAAVPDGAIAISARTGANIDTLRRTITDRLAALTGTLDDTRLIVTNARHAEAFRQSARCASAVADGLRSALPPDFIAQDLREALYHLSTVTGEITTPDILQSIFENFCIGK